MHSPAKPLVRSPFSRGPGAESPARPQRVLTNEASTHNEVCVSPPPVPTRMPALKTIIQSLNKQRASRTAQGLATDSCLT